MNMKELRVIATSIRRAANTNNFIINWPISKRKSSSSRNSRKIRKEIERSRQVSR